MEKYDFFVEGSSSGDVKLNTREEVTVEIEFLRKAHSRGMFNVLNYIGFNGGGRSGYLPPKELEECLQEMSQMAEPGKGNLPIIYSTGTTVFVQNPQISLNPKYVLKLR